MTDPTPSVPVEAMYALSRGYPLSISQSAEIIAHIANLEAALAADPCVRHACKRVRVEMQAQIDEARRDAEALRERVELVIASMDYTDAYEYAVELRAAMGATHEG